MEKTLVILLCSIAVPLLTPVRAFAQEPKTFGVWFGTGTTAGVTWDALSRLTIRADVSASWSSSESDASASISTAVYGPSSPVLGPPVSVEISDFGPDIRTESSSFVVGLSALITLARWDELRAYAGPRIAFTRASSRTVLTYDLSEEIRGLFPGAGFSYEDVDVTTVNHNYSVAGLFGTEYRPIDRFGIFGEAGLLYSTPTFSPLDDGDRKQLGTTARIGVVLFLK